MLHATLQVVRFELLRTLRRGRIALWIALAGFPSLLMLLVQLQSRGDVPEEALAVMSYVLVPQISCMLGLLLWATPVVGSEIEAQSWVYLTLRSQGRAAIVLGKYLVSVIWTSTFGLVSAIGISLISLTSQPVQLALAISTLVILSSFCYAALYTLIGVALFRRATVLAVVYSLIIEGAVSWVPATINKITVSYRLRTLLAEWIETDRIRQAFPAGFGEGPAWQHLLVLAFYAVILMTIATLIVRSREYPVQSDA